MKTAREILSRALDRDKDDSLERSEHAFQGMTDEQLDQQHGQSGKTRRWWLEADRQNRREWEQARRLADAIGDMEDSLRQWAAAERTGDEVELNNARAARDRVLVALDPLEIGAVYRTPYEPAGLFRVLEIEPHGNGYKPTARGVFVGDHPAGYPDGSPGRYFVKELIGRKVEP